MSTRRSYGTGSLYARADNNGRETWYALWWADTRRMKRKVGPKRSDGERDGLTRSQAEAKMRKMIAEVRPTAEITTGLTIEDLGHRYLQHLDRQGRKKATTVAVTSVWNVWLIPFFADRDLGKITAPDVEDLVRMMEQGTKPGPRRKGDRRHRRPVGPKTIRNYIGTLSAMLGFAERKGWLQRNVAHRVDLPANPPHDDIRFLDPTDLAVLVDHAGAGDYHDLDRALYLTAAMTGLRQGELVALRWQDIDWTAQRVRVRQNHVLGEFGTPKSKRSTRSVPLADQVAGELDRLHRASARTQDADLVFADPHTAGPMDKAAILRRFKKSLKAALIAEHRFHDLRHTFGTRMAGAGVPMRTLQEWMGHRDIETTQRYADYAPSAREAEYVAAAFGAPPAATPADPTGPDPARGSVRGSNVSEPERI